MFAVAEKGALTDMLELTGAGCWAAPGNTEEIAANFLRALALPAISPEESQAQWHKLFHYRSLTERLAALIWDLSRSPDRSVANLEENQVGLTEYESGIHIGAHHETRLERELERGVTE
jgi:hypothetical protein